MYFKLILICTFYLISSSIFSLNDLWKKPKLFKEIIDTDIRAVKSLVKVTSVASDGKVRDQLEMHAVGMVKANIEDAWFVINQYDAYPKFVKELRECKYAPVTKELYFYAIIKAILKEFHMKTYLKLSESIDKTVGQEQYKLHFVAVKEMFIGMTGTIGLENINGKLIASFEAKFAPGDYTLFKVIGFFVEKVLESSGKEMRRIIEKKSRNKPV